MPLGSIPWQVLTSLIVMLGAQAPSTSESLMMERQTCGAMHCVRCWHMLQYYHDVS
jgi:hypothetical protein